MTNEYSKLPLPKIILGKWTRIASDARKQMAENYNDEIALEVMKKLRPAFEIDLEFGEAFRKKSEESLWFRTNSNYLAHFVCHGMLGLKKARDIISANEIVGEGTEVDEGFEKDLEYFGHPTCTPSSGISRCLNLMRETIGEDNTKEWYKITLEEAEKRLKKTIELM